MTDTPIEPPPPTAQEQIAALEARIVVLEKAMNVAFGVTWIEQVREQVKAEK